MAASIKCDERPFKGGIWGGFAPLSQKPGGLEGSAPQPKILKNKVFFLFFPGTHSQGLIPNRLNYRHAGMVTKRVSRLDFDDGIDAIDAPAPTNIVSKAFPAALVCKPLTSLGLVIHLFLPANPPAR